MKKSLVPSSKGKLENSKAASLMKDEESTSVGQRSFVDNRPAPLGQQTILASNSSSNAAQLMKNALVAQLGPKPTKGKGKRGVRVGGRRYGRGVRGGGLGLLSDSIYSKLDERFTRSSIFKSVKQSYLDGTTWAIKGDYGSFDDMVASKEFQDWIKATLILKKQGINPKWSRPSFSSLVYRMACAHHIASTVDVSLAGGLKYQDTSSRVDLSGNNLAVPHRYPFATMKDIVQSEEDTFPLRADSVNLADTLTTMTTQKSAEVVGKMNTNGYGAWTAPYLKDKNTLQGQLTNAKTIISTQPKAYSHKQARDILSGLNNAPGNVPDLGPHNGVNIQVSDRLHLNTVPDTRPTSRGRRLSVSSSIIADNKRLVDLSKGTATTSDSTRGIAPDGHQWDPSTLPLKEEGDVRRKSSATSIARV